MEFEAEHLPSGLTIDRDNGLIAGTLPREGRFLVRLRARNRAGQAEKDFTIVSGETIALTPPMGWNSWNCLGGRVSEEKVRAAAHALVASGLRDHGWTYVNIDNGWQGRRGGAFQAIQPNPKFPDMRALADEIHGLGLKVGIYSSPWRVGYGGFIGSSADRADGTIETPARMKNFSYQTPEFHSFLDEYSWLKPLAKWSQAKKRKAFKERLNRVGRFSFVQQDVRQWADWEMDYLKYDWVPIDLPHAAEMSHALKTSGRDIFYSLSNNARLPLAPELAKLAGAWRTTVDLGKTWQKVSDIGFSRDRWAPFNGPGHFNDPDMLVLGVTEAVRPHDGHLTSDEQYSHMTLWCLLSGPLLLGCDLEKLDPFTLGLLTNDEVLAVNQDPLCRQATRVARSGEGNVYAKLLEDGSWAVGLFNRGPEPMKVVVRWADLGLAESQPVRDLWRQKDIGACRDQFGTSVASHGVVLLRIGRPAR